MVRPPIILNLGCGVKTSRECVNIDWSLGHRIARNPLLRAVARLVLDGRRMQKLKGMSDREIVAHDLRKGIPYPDNSVDVVYHSHILEHIDRPQANQFLLEIKRVLKPGGIHRIVVPDLERLAKDVVVDFSQAPQSTEWRMHDNRIGLMIEQMVRREAGATLNLPPMRRRLEKAILGDARKRGDTHQWMYDRINLPGLLHDIGFREIGIFDYRSSRIAGWQRIGLDCAADGIAEYKPESLYVECIK